MKLKLSYWNSVVGCIFLQLEEIFVSQLLKSEMFQVRCDNVSRKSGKGL